MTMTTTDPTMTDPTMTDPTMTDPMADPMALVGFVAFDRDGVELGQIEGVYMGDEEPEWAAVLLTNGSFVVVPLDEAELYEDSLDLPFTVEEVMSAPLQQDDLLEDLTEDQEYELSAYFSGSDGSGADGSAGGADAKEAAADVATQAKEQGRQVAETAVDQTHEVASTAKEEGRRVASTAKAQAQQVVHSTAEQAGEVVATAKEQAAEVADAASVQARNLLEETRTRLEEQTVTGAQRLGEQLQRLGEEALALSEGRPDEAPTMQGYAKRAADTLLDAADRAYGLSEDVETRGIASVLADVQSFARRRPGVFLLGTATLGLVAGRAVRASQGGDDDAAPEPPVRPRRAGTGAGRR